MKTQNQAPQTSTTRSMIWVTLSVLSAIGGLGILIFVSAFSTILILAGLFLAIYIISRPVFESER
ncbi:MAG: hypothetical protein V4722_14800 [Bacteroidota bacterium]